VPADDLGVDGLDGGASAGPELSRPSVETGPGAHDSLDGAAIMIAVFVSGAVLLGVEIAASRVLAPFFGHSLYVWGSLIGVVLTGLAIGSSDPDTHAPAGAGRGPPSASSLTPKSAPVGHGSAPGLCREARYPKKVFAAS